MFLPLVKLSLNTNIDNPKGHSLSVLYKIHSNFDYVRPNTLAKDETTDKKSKKENKQNKT